MLFRTQNNVPEIYVNESRDFQLLCRLKDALFGGVKYTIDSLNHTSNTLEMNATLLPLLKSKVGFFEQEELTEDELRYLLNGFPELVKYKGSKKSIQKAVFLWFRVYRIQGRLVDIDIDNENYTINITIDAKTIDTILLDEIFKYILPTGYIVNYSFAYQEPLYSHDILQLSAEGINIHNKINSNVRVGNEYDDALENRLIGSVGFTEIMTKADLESQASDVDDIKKLSYKEIGGIS